MDNPFLQNINKQNDSNTSNINGNSEETSKNNENVDGIKIGAPGYGELLSNLSNNIDITDLPKLREISSVLGVVDIKQDKEKFEDYMNFIEGLEILEKDEKIYWLPNGVKNGGDGLLVSQMNRYWLTIEKIKQLTEVEIVKFTYKNHPSNIKNIELKRKIEDELKNTLKEVLVYENNLDKIKNYYLKLLMWIEEIVPNLENGNSIKNFVLEGSIKRDTSDFLNILRNVGVEIVYINVSKEEMVVRNNNLKNYVISRTINNDLVGEGKVSLSRLLKHLEKFEKEDSSRVTTVARKASEEINEILHGEGTGLIKPWQFENYDVHVTQLKSTYDEVLQLWEENANMRSGFKVSKGMVSVPSFFVKVSGVPEYIEKYWLDYDKFTSSKNTKVVTSLPFVRDRGEAKRPLIYGSNGFNKEEIKKLGDYKYSYLRESIQDLIIDRMNELIENEEILKLRTEGMSRKYKILDVCLNISDDLLELLQKFDFGQEIPKFVMYLNKKESINESEGILISLLHLIGFDIVFLVPTGYRNIENIINDKYFEVHRLANNELNLDVPVISERRVEVTEDRLSLWESIRSRFK